MQKPPLQRLWAQCANACDACALLCGSVAADPNATRELSAEQAALLSCAEVCRLTAKALHEGREGAPHLCTWCADVCETCANSPRAAAEWAEIAASCRECAARCREVAGSPAPDF